MLSAGADGSVIGFSVGFAEGSGVATAPGVTVAVGSAVASGRYSLYTSINLPSFILASNVYSFFVLLSRTFVRFGSHYMLSSFSSSKTLSIVTEGYLLVEPHAATIVLTKSLISSSPFVSARLIPE